jgi:phospholipid/cholesterol/gamma-HCH transport system substrate-binding protein
MTTSSRKGSPISNDTIVGLFVFLVFLGLALFTIVLSGMSLIGEGGSTLYVKFDRVGGLKRHDSVIVRGMPVGQVKALALKEDGVVVTLALNQPVNVREGYHVRAESTSLLGGMQLVLETGEGSPVSCSFSHPLVGMPPENVMDSANSLIDDIRTSLNEGGIRTNLEAIVEDIRVVTGNIRSGQGTIGHLLSTNDVFYSDLASTVSNIAAIAARVERGEGTVGRLLSSDETPYNQLTNFVNSLYLIGERVERGEGMVGRLLSSDETTYNQLTNFVASLDSIGTRLKEGEGAIGRLLSPDDPLATDLADTVHNLKVITDRLERGEGLLGQLMNDDGEVGKQVNGLLKDGRDLIDDYRETSPVSTFSSIFFGAL